MLQVSMQTQIDAVNMLEFDRKCNNMTSAVLFWCLVIKLKGVQESKAACCLDCCYEMLCEI